jgi:NitT/TauT family transport system substrate-binding protein
MRSAARISAVLVGALLLGGWAQLPGAMGAAPQKILFGIVGANTANWALYTAEEKGFFRQAGVEIEEIKTGGPVQSIQQTATGAVNIATAGTDSWIRAVAQRLSVKIVAPAFRTNPYALITQPGITSWDQLKGKTVILGTRTDVTAIALDAMARAHGLSLSDFTIVLAGSTNDRYAALKSGHVDAAMLTQPFDLLSVAEGKHQLAASAQYITKWLFTAYAVHTKWAETNRPAVVGFIKGLIEGVRYDYAHPDEAIQIMVARSKAPADVVRNAYALDFTQWHAFNPTEELDPSDLQAVITAVVAQGTVKQPPAISDLYDPSYAREAQGR